MALVPLLYHTVGLLFWQLLVLVFLGGFLDAPGHTARQSLVPDLAGGRGRGSNAPTRPSRPSSSPPCSSARRWPDF